MNLPFDIQVVILSFLPYRILEVYAIKNILPFDLTLATIKYKFPENSSQDTNHNYIEGIVNNLYNNCFICSKVLGMNYNISLCYFCSIDLEGNLRYPKICHNCSEHKLKRGQYKFSFCYICNNPTSHLGITPFS